MSPLDDAQGATGELTPATENAVNDAALAAEAKTIAEQMRTLKGLEAPLDATGVLRSDLRTLADSIEAGADEDKLQLARNRVALELALYVAKTQGQDIPQQVQPLLNQTQDLLDRVPVLAPVPAYFTDSEPLAAEEYEAIRDRAQELNAGVHDMRQSEVLGIAGPLTNLALAARLNAENLAYGRLERIFDLSVFENRIANALARYKNENADRDLPPALQNVEAYLAERAPAAEQEQAREQEQVQEQAPAESDDLVLSDLTRAPRERTMLGAASGYLKKLFGRGNREQAPRIEPLLLDETFEAPQAPAADISRRVDNVNGMVATLIQTPNPYEYQYAEMVDGEQQALFLLSLLEKEQNPTNSAIRAKLFAALAKAREAKVPAFNALTAPQDALAVKDVLLPLADAYQTVLTASADLINQTELQADGTYKFNKDFAPNSDFFLSADEREAMTRMSAALAMRTREFSEFDKDVQFHVDGVTFFKEYLTASLQDGALEKQDRDEGFTPDMDALDTAAAWDALNQNTPQLAKLALALRAFSTQTDAGLRGDLAVAFHDAFLASENGEETSALTEEAASATIKTPADLTAYLQENKGKLTLAQIEALGGAVYNNQILPSQEEGHALDSQADQAQDLNQADLPAHEPAKNFQEARQYLAQSLDGFAQAGDQMLEGNFPEEDAAELRKVLTFAQQFAENLKTDWPQVRSLEEFDRQRVLLSQAMSQLGFINEIAELGARRAGPMDSAEWNAVVQSHKNMRGDFSDFLLHHAKESTVFTEKFDPLRADMVQFLKENGHQDAETVVDFASDHIFKRVDALAVALALETAQAGGQKLDAIRAAEFAPKGEGEEQAAEPEAPTPEEAHAYSARNEFLHMAGQHNFFANVVQNKREAANAARNMDDALFRMVNAANGEFEIDEPKVGGKLRKIAGALVFGKDVASSFVKNAAAQLWKRRAVIAYGAGFGFVARTAAGLGTTALIGAGVIGAAPIAALAMLTAGGAILGGATLGAFNARMSTLFDQNKEEGVENAGRAAFKQTFGELVRLRLLKDTAASLAKAGGALKAAYNAVREQDAQAKEDGTLTRAQRVKWVFRVLGEANRLDPAAMRLAIGSMLGGVSAGAGHALADFILPDAFNGHLPEVSFASAEVPPGELAPGDLVPGSSAPQTGAGTGAAVVAPQGGAPAPQGGAPTPQATPTPAPQATPTPAPQGGAPAPQATPTPAPQATPTPAPQGGAPAPQGSAPAPQATPTPAPQATPTPAPQGSAPAPQATPTPVPQGGAPAPQGGAPAPQGGAPAPQATPTPAPQATPTPAPQGGAPAPQGGAPAPQGSAPAPLTPSPAIRQAVEAATTNTGKVSAVLQDPAFVRARDYVNSLNLTPDQRQHFDTLLARADRGSFTALNTLIDNIAEGGSFQGPEGRFTDIAGMDRNYALATELRRAVSANVTEADFNKPGFRAALNLNNDHLAALEGRPSRVSAALEQNRAARVSAPAPAPQPADVARTADAPYSGAMPNGSDPLGDQIQRSLAQGSPAPAPEAPQPPRRGILQRIFGGGSSNDAPQPPANGTIQVIDLPPAHNAWASEFMNTVGGRFIRGGMTQENFNQLMYGVENNDARSIGMLKSWSNSLLNDRTITLSADETRVLRGVAQIGQPSGPQYRIRP